MQQHWNIRRPLAALVSVIMAIAGFVALEAPAHAADAGDKGPYYGQAAGTTGGHVPGSPTAQKPQSKLWFAHGSWWGALWSDTTTNTGEAFTIHRYDWGANTWSDTGVKLETRARSDLDLLWDGSKLYVASNTDAGTVVEQRVDVSRFSYSGGVWSLEWTTLVSNAYAYAPVIEKDSTGMLWMTYTQGTKVMVTHSMPGNEQSWETPYQLPTPNGESDVSFDATADPSQSSSDIASIVHFDGNKIGVLWSNQSTDTVYWASHADGAPQEQWSTQVAYTAPEGADDHISLKSVTGTDGGRVYAVTKTSMNGAEPVFEVLVLRLNGTWDHFPYASADTNLTRPIILLHPARQELYVFAAAGENNNSGGSIYYKKTSMTSPDFGPLSSRGTLFIADSSLTADADTERINNPSSTKQNLDATTGLLVVANNDPTDYYYYNRMNLSDLPPDTTAPDTTITGGPSGATQATSATFRFSSTEAGTFECRLDSPDPAPWQPCASPQSYTVTEGTHTFEVRAKDAAGNTDSTPASRTWTVDTTAPDTMITGGPSVSTDQTTASFTFTATEAATFKCQLDGASWKACKSPKDYAGLGGGDHTFAVRAKDAAGNTDATPASWTWTVTAPVCASRTSPGRPTC